MVGNTHELQNGRTTARDWFMRAAAQVKPDVVNGITAQGRYVITPDGTALGYNNNRSVERVTAMLAKSLDSFKSWKSASEPVNLDPIYSARPPLGATLVRVVTRIRPVPTGADPANENVAQDHLWIPKEEIQSVLLTGKLDPKTLMRIARFSLNDNVRGEPDHWKASEVKRLDLRLEPGGNGGNFGIRGRIEMRTDDNKRSLALDVVGRLKTDPKTFKVLEFKLLANGVAFGRSTYTPNPPEGQFPIAFAFVLAADDIAREVPPQAIFYGREYFEP